MPSGRIDKSLATVLESGRAGGVFSQASAWVARDGRLVAEGSTTTATKRTIYDVASLTKPMVVVTLAMRGVTEGWLDLHRPVAPDLPSAITAYALLGHRAGMPPWKDLVVALPPPRTPGSFEARYAVDALVRQAAREADPGRGVDYSDLGFILLGRHLEALTGAPLDRHVVAGRYRGIRRSRSRSIARTGWCPWRERELVGEVHDPNAWVMGGVAGHAGIFASAAEVGRWALGLERAAAEDRPYAGIDPAVVRDFWDRKHILDGTGSRGGTWVLGWDTPSATGSSGGANISANAVGHLGFTGTSVWIDRSARLVTVLLSNRVALGAASQLRMKAFRGRFHDRVRDLLDVDRSNR